MLTIFFFSLDDPLIQQLPSRDQGTLFEALLAQWAQVAGTALHTSSNTLYCFLDEIQRLPRWELYIKRYIDLRYPIRFIISGSASHTIFRKSLESLLGRLVDIALPPFTFREYVRFHHPEHKEFLTTFTSETFDIGDTSSLKKFFKSLSAKSSSESIQQWNLYAEEYATAGGFPQLWEMQGAQNELRLSITNSLSVSRLRICVLLKRFAGRKFFINFYVTHLLELGKNTILRNLRHLFIQHE